MEQTVDALCVARDSALRTIEHALSTVERTQHPALSAMRNELVRKLHEAKQTLARPAALLLADQDLLRTTWIELQRALAEIQTMQTNVDHFIAAAPQDSGG
jgi:hypothetical protein